MMKEQNSSSCELFVMGSGWSRAFVFVGVLTALFQTPCFAKVSPTPTSTSTALPLASPTPTASVLAVSAQDQAALLAEFVHSQKSELKALNHRYKFEIKELRISQDTRRKDWERREKDARYKYFAEHPKGPDRREYVGSFIKRREEQGKLMKDEQTQRLDEQEKHLKAIQKLQGENLKTFKKELADGKAPSGDLWPKSGQ